MKMRLGFLIAAMALVWLLLGRMDDARNHVSDVQVSVNAS